MRIALCLEYPMHVRGGVSALVETLMQELKQQAQADMWREHVHWNDLSPCEMNRPLFPAYEETLALAQPA